MQKSTLTTTSYVTVCPNLNRFGYASQPLSHHTYMPLKCEVQNKQLANDVNDQQGFVSRLPTTMSNKNRYVIGSNANPETDDLVSRAIEFAFQGESRRAISITQGNDEYQNAYSSGINDQGVPLPRTIDNSHCLFHSAPSFDRDISCSPLSTDVYGEEYGSDDESNFRPDV